MPEDFREKQIGDLTVRIKRDLCIGSGNCTKVAPEVFELDDATIAAFREDVGEVDPQRLIEACDVCPVDALIALDSRGRQVVPRA